MGDNKNKVNLRAGLTTSSENISLIAIVFDPTFSFVCDMVLGYKDGSKVSLADANDDSCKLDWDVLDNAYVLYTDEKSYPIVGLHGLKTKDSKQSRLADLGVIWLDTEN